MGVVFSGLRGRRSGFVADVDLKVADAALFPFLFEVVEFCSAAENCLFLFFAGVDCICLA